MRVKKIGRFVWLIVIFLLSGCANHQVVADEITIISREDGSGTRSAFSEMFDVMGERNGYFVDITTPESQITNSTSVVITSVAEDKNAIGYISMGVPFDNVKKLNIDGVEATAENVNNGKYKIARPFLIVVKEGNQNKLAGDFISFVQSTDGQKIVAENQYVPIMAKSKYEKSQLTGTLVIGGSSSVAPVIEKLIEGYREENPNIKIELQVTDSTTGTAETQSGNYDIGMVSRNLKDSENNLTPITIAMDGIVLIVHPQNPISSLSSEQVRAIYVGETTTWGEVLSE